MAGKAVAFASIALICVVSTSGSARAQDDEPSYSIEDVTACSRDAMRLCKDKMPDVSAIEVCMKAHIQELRPKCRARFNR